MKNKKNGVTLIVEKGKLSPFPKYKVEMILPSKPEQLKMLNQCQFSEEKWCKDPSRYNDVFEGFIDSIVYEMDDVSIIDFWETKQIPYTVNDYYKKYMSIFEVEKKEPVRFKTYFYTDKPLDKKEFNRNLSDKLIEVFGTDFLAVILTVDRIKELPNEIERKKINIPLETLLPDLKKSADKSEAR